MCRSGMLQRPSSKPCAGFAMRWLAVLKPYTRDPYQGGHLYEASDDP